MFENTRQKEIFDLVSKMGSCSVDDLANHFNVSKMTIRRDLDKLQEVDLLKRTHGGAMLPQVLFKEMTYLEKQTKNIETKKMLAQNAIKYVYKNSVIYLDAGTTTFELAKLISDRKDICFVTNDLRIASHLSAEGCKVYIPGGLVSNDTDSIYSPEAMMLLETLNIDIAFLAASSIDNNMYICTPTEEKVHLKRFMIKTAPIKVLIADKDKFNKKSLHKIFNINDVDYVVSDYEDYADDLNV